MENKVTENKIFTVEELTEKGINVKEAGPIIVKALHMENSNQALVIEGGRFLTIITKDGQKIIYDKTRMPDFTPDLLSNIMVEGTSPEKVDEIVDNFFKRDTFGMVIDDEGKHWPPSAYPNTIIDNPEKIQKFNEHYQQQEQQQQQQQTEYKHRPSQYARGEDR